jgi:hypothetical protein
MHVRRSYARQNENTLSPLLLHNSTTQQVVHPSPAEVAPRLLVLLLLVLLLLVLLRQ